MMPFGEFLRNVAEILCVYVQMVENFEKKRKVPFKVLISLNGLFYS